MDDSKLIALMEEHIMNNPRYHYDLDLEVFKWKKTMEAFPPALTKAFDNYLESGEYPDLSANGWSLKRVAEVTGFDAFGVFREMNDLMTDPNFAKQFGSINFRRK